MQTTRPMPTPSAGSPLRRSTLNHFFATTVERPTSRLRTTTAAFVAAFGLSAVLLGGMLPCGVVHAADAQHTDGHSAGSGDHGHLPEIGHNPPPGTTQKAFESPAWFQTDLAVWSFAVFLALFALLSKFAWKPIMQGLEKREQGIADMIASTQAANEDAKRMLASYERRLAETADEVRGMLEEARRDADVTRQTIVAEARKAADDEQVRARHEIGLAKDEALAQIADRAGDLAVEVAGKFLREKLGREDQARLVRDSVASIGTTPSMN